MTTRVVQRLEPDDLQRLNQLLNLFVGEAGARCTLLVDRTGRLVTAAGSVTGFDQTTFASLAAADFEASDQLAMLLGEQEFSALYHQGEQGSMYLTDIAGEAILAAIFDHHTTLGMVRLKTRSIVPRVVSLFGEITDRPESERPALEAGWLEDASDEIDRLFGG